MINSWHKGLGLRAATLAVTISMPLALNAMVHLADQCQQLGTSIRLDTWKGIDELRLDEMPYLSLCKSDNVEPLLQRTFNGGSDMAMVMEGRTSGTSGSSGNTNVRDNNYRRTSNTLTNKVSSPSAKGDALRALLNKSAAPNPVTGPVAPPSQPQQTPGRAAIQQPQASGGGSYSGGAVTATGTGAYAGAPAAPWDPAGDPTYGLEAAGINQDADSLIAKLARERSGYDINFGEALRNLGWAGPKGASGIDEIISGGAWNPQDLLGAYGQAQNNQQNDYAGRGMLGSSFYDQARNNMATSFDDQRSSLVGSRSSYFDDLTQQKTDTESSRKQALAQAKATAAARAAASLGLG